MAADPRGRCRRRGPRPDRRPRRCASTGHAARSSMTSGGIRSGAIARSASSPAAGTSTGQPDSPCQAGRRTAPRFTPWASMSDVTVSAPTHVIRAGQSRKPVVSADLREGRLAASDHLTDRTRLRQGGRGVRRLGAGERGDDVAVRVRRDDDDRKRAARPGKVRQTGGHGADPGRRERALGRGGQDDGGDGHRASVRPASSGRPGGAVTKAALGCSPASMRSRSPATGHRRLAEDDTRPEDRSATSGPARPLP